MTNDIDYENDPQLNIVNVAYLCNLTDLIAEGYRFTTTCPFCGAKPGHFYLTPVVPQTSYKNVFKCVRCGESGSSVMLYFKLHNCATTKEAYKQIKGFDVRSEVKKIIKKSKKAIVPQFDIASIELRNNVYRRLLQKLTLSKPHYLNLLNRGLSNDFIRQSMFRTLPKDHSFKRVICKQLLKEGFSLKGIPGFYTDYHQNWTFWTPKEGGFLVPAIDYSGKVQAFQVRKDSTNKKKYPWFSSSYMENGTRTSGFIHVQWNRAHSAKEVTITEGPLKATVASKLSDTTFVAVPGVNSFSDIVPVLKNIGAQKICVAYDMDKFQNIYVMAALNKLCKHLLKNGYKDLVIRNWNPSYKGIDDYLAYISKNKNSHEICS